MPKQIDVKVSKPQNKHGHRRTRKCPIENLKSMIGRIFYITFFITKVLFLLFNLQR